MDDLAQAAAGARLNAYAPYSKFHVGAAMRDENGIIHSGCNVENAAYPQGTCAEAGALSALAMSGARKIMEMAVAGAGPVLVTPCGGCRQKIREFAGPDVKIHICDDHGTVRRTFTLEELFPASFGPDNLEIQP